MHNRTVETQSHDVEHSDIGSIPEPKDSFSALLRPRGLAVVGASAKDFSLGQRLLSGVVQGGYRGAVYPVNPGYEDLEGLTCYPSLEAIPGPVDCVAFAIAEHRLEMAMAEAAAAGVRGAVVFSRGYVPPGAARPTAVERWADVAREAGIAVCGDNCMGLMNFVDGLRITGNPPETSREYGPVGLLSHSGSTWSGLIGNQRQLVYNYAVSVGREIVTGIPEYMQFLLDQEETRAIGLVLETIRDRDGFIAALERAEECNVPIVALKLGRSEKGQFFAFSHSGAVAGSDSAFQALCERYHVSRVSTLDEFTDTLEMMCCDREPTSDGIGVGTDSGGERQLITDIGADVGVKFAELTTETKKRLEEVLDPGLEPANPVDYWGDGRLYWEECLKILADDLTVGMVVMATNMVPGRRILYIATENIENVHNYCPKPAVMMGNLHSTIDRGEAQRLRNLGIPVLMGTHTGLSAIAHFLAYHHRPQADSDAVPEAISSAVIERWRSRLESATAGQALEADAAMELLSDFGCPVVAGRVATSEVDALRAAEAVGYPVVVKTAMPGVLHKSDTGGVVTDIRDADATRDAYRRLAETFGPDVQVQEQAAPGVEILLGMVNDPQLGPMVTVGLGGLFVEVLKDVVTFMPPIGKDQAGDYLTRLRGYSLLQGARGTAAADVEALATAISRFSSMAQTLGHLLSEVDVNPLIVGAEGAVAVDALILPKVAKTARQP